LTWLNLTTRLPADQYPARLADVVITAILACGLLAVFLLCGTSAASVAIAVRLLVLDTACHG
jgi:hypothetical protein